MELFQMPTEESMLQVCSMAPENVYWEYSAGIETSSKCLYRFCLRGNYLNTPDTQRFSVKGSLILFLELFPAVHYIFMPNLYKRMSFPSGLKKSVHERSY
jgi:hypothetical protein